MSLSRKHKNPEQIILDTIPISTGQTIPKFISCSIETMVSMMQEFSNQNIDEQRHVNSELLEGLKSCNNLRKSLSDIQEAIGSEYHPANWKQLWNNISDFITYQEDIVKKHTT